MNHLLKKFWKDITGLVWLSGAAFLGLALYSYNPMDPSFNSLGNNPQAQNFCGYFGSFLADLLYQTFGLGAWIFVLAALRMSLFSFMNKNIHFQPWRLFVGLLLVLDVASLISLYFPEQRIFLEQIPLGGIVGVAISGSLQSLFNFAGVALILNTLAGVLLVFYTERPLSELFAWPLKGMKSLALWFKEEFRPWNWAQSLWELFQPAFASGVPAVNRALRSIESGITASGSKDEASVKTGSKLFKIKKEETQTAKGRFLPIPESHDDEEEWEEEMDDDTDFDDSGEELEASEEPKIGGFFSKIKTAPVKKKKLKIKPRTRVENWDMPKLSLLVDPPATRAKLDEKEIKNKAKLLVEKLAQFSVRGEVVGIKPGPAVTMFEFKPAADVKISKITDLADDLSLALSSESVRIIAPIPGRDVVGIETSNSQRDNVYLKDVLEHEPFWDDDIKLPIALGRQADGEPRIVDLRKMPHLLVAGTTGSGKSVFVVSALVGLLFRHSPKTLKLILVDPKQVDLAAFNDLPHLIMPPIREPKKAVGALRWAIREMEKRYRSMSKFGARGIESFNEIVEGLNKSQLEEHEAFNEALETPAHPESYYHSPQPYIVIVVEEFGDLMAVDKVNVEQAVVRLAQMARACGIHLVLAMQSPRKDVVTGLIKTNIPGRITFKVASKMDSRIILDESGGERLLARGDMLFLAPGVSKPQRHHGAYLSEAEIADLVNSWKSQGEPEFDPIAMRVLEGSGGGFDLPGSDSEGGDGYDEIDKDDKYDEVLAYVASQKEVSASLLQRKFRLGYPRAARMIEIFESEGVVGPANGSKPRQVLVRDLKEL